MRGARGNPICLWLRCILLASASSLGFACADCDDPPGETHGTGSDLRGRGPLVSRYSDITACTPVRYSGPETPLYSNRPYHTQTRVEPIRGLSFCRGERHGTNLWIIEVSQATTLFAVGNAAFGLEDRGWTPKQADVLVRAAGTPLDSLYSSHFEPGRYVIRQGFSRTAPLIFWDDRAVKIAR